MAKYDVTWFCGHVTVEQLFGKVRDRESWIKSAEGRLCPDCLAAKRKANAEALQEASGLPELKGSEKQVVWAITIRDGIMKKVAELREKFERKVIEVARPQFFVIFDEWVNELKCNTSAKWWIENQDMIVQRRFEADKRDELIALDKKVKEGQQ